MQKSPGALEVRDLTDVSLLLTEARRLTRRLNAVLAEDGLREDLWRIMRSLSQSDGLLMGRLSESLQLPPATTTRLVDELTDMGIVFRRPAPDDARKAVVHLSRLGTARLARVEDLLSGRLFAVAPDALQPCSYPVG